MDMNDPRTQAIRKALEAHGVPVPPDDVGVLADVMREIEKRVAEGLTPEEAIDAVMDEMWPEDEIVRVDEKGRVILEGHEDGSYTAQGDPDLAWVHPDGTETILNP